MLRQDSASLDPLVHAFACIHVFVLVVEGVASTDGRTLLVALVDISKLAFDVPY